MASEAGNRITTKTDKAQSLYQEYVQTYKNKLLSVCRHLDDTHQQHAINRYDSVDDCNRVQIQVSRLLQEYSNISRELGDYLKRQNTLEAIREFSSQKLIDGTVEQKCNETFRDLEHIICQLSETQSVTSKSSRHSSRHSHSMSGSDRSTTSRSSRASTERLLAEAKAKQARFRFAEREKELKLQKAVLNEETAIVSASSEKKQAFLEAEFELLSEEKEAASAEAIIETLTNTRIESDISSEISSKEERIKSYISQQEQFKTENSDMFIGVKSETESAIHSSTPHVLIASCAVLETSESVPNTNRNTLSTINADTHVTFNTISPQPVIPNVVELSSAVPPQTYAVFTHQPHTVTPSHSDMDTYLPIGPSGLPNLTSHFGFPVVVTDKHLSSTPVMSSVQSAYSTPRYDINPTKPVSRNTLNVPITNIVSTAATKYEHYSEPKVFQMAAFNEKATMKPYTCSEGMPSVPATCQTWTNPASSTLACAQPAHVPLSIPDVNLTSTSPASHLLTNQTYHVPMFAQATMHQSTFSDPVNTMTTLPCTSSQTPHGQNPVSFNQLPHVPAQLAAPNKQAPALQTECLTTYLARKDLNLARFSKFNDDPANYSAWKNSFQCILKELYVKPDEEIDLLLKWLGPESSRQVSSLRISNSHNPAVGLTKIWQRLDQRYGAPELIESALKKKVAKFPRINFQDYSKLYDLHDLLAEIQSLKENPKYQMLLSYYDTSAGTNPVVAKLPVFLQSKWTDRAARYKNSNGVPFPPFTYLLSFIEDMATIYNDPSFKYVDVHDRNQKTVPPYKNQVQLQTRKTSLRGMQKEDGCYLHPQCSHKLSECKKFMRKYLTERKKILKEKGLCYRCCDGKHEAKKCTANLKCSECGLAGYPTALHVPVSKANDEQSRARTSNTHNGGEQTLFNTKCTTVCGNFQGRSCAKILPVKIRLDQQPQKCLEVYAILDDQSNCSLVSPELLDSLDAHGEEIQYTLSSCSGKFKASGRKVHGFTVEALDGTYSSHLPALIECTDIPNDTSEIATSDIVKHYEHLKEVPIPPYTEGCQISLLIGRDAPDLHQVQEQVIGQKDMPFAQRLHLGWVIIGEVCLGRVHKPMKEIRAFKTSILHDGRRTIFEPCQNCLGVKEDIFLLTKEDEKLGLSVDDQEFLDLMDSKTFRNKEGNWTSPLPFRSPRETLPNNRTMALKRAMILDKILQRNNTKREHFVEFMDKVLKSGAAEVAPPAEGELWYLPIFGVYHPQKPDQVRGVFDSSATYQGISLNKTLLTGPNLTNSLLGILLRFRKDQYAIAADIEQMFYSFLVPDDHRNFLRFLWYKDNNPDLELIDYRMRAHVFGNSPSPAVASYGLRKCVEGEDVDGDVKKLVTEDFYVDDALTSKSTKAEVVSLVKRTQSVLKDKGNLRLHKIVSNSPEVINSFPVEDRGKEVKTLSLGQDLLPSHRSLGMLWDMNLDQFLYEIPMKDTTSTRRGMLSYLNSIYDPLGFVAPVTIQGKILMRQITQGYSWDDKVEPDIEEKWQAFQRSVRSVENLTISRMIVPVSLSSTEKSELHVFCDASEQAICAVVYLKTYRCGEIHTGFVIGKSKVAPQHGHSIPRLELCAAVLATELAETVRENLDTPLESVYYYSDSKVALGYIHNRTRRFYNYVSNRVQRILRQCSADQWSYVSTKHNPADVGTRGSCTFEDVQYKWLRAPEMMCKARSEEKAEFQLVSPDEDKEIRLEVRKTAVSEPPSSFSDRFEKFSDWRRLVTAFSLIKRCARALKDSLNKQEDTSRQNLQTDTEQQILRLHQREQFEEEIQCLQSSRPVPVKSSIRSLYPVLDSTGILRVGGRLGQGSLSLEETNPVIVSAKSHVAKLLVRNFHEKFKHQGRLFTEATLRNNGYWIIGAKRLIAQIIYHCVVCRKLRGQTRTQRMADLPTDRLTPAPPFTSVGIDAFGPWEVVTRRTRGGSANSKRWAIIFTCMGTRAVHIEVVEEMSTSSFLNALRRVIAIRGDIKELRSDRGTNFVGAAEALRKIDSKIVWKFNPPHSSHMGGVWERLIGIARRILDAMLLEVSSKVLTHETLVTFMAEVSAIINSRPIAPLSTDPEEPVILNPSILLTQKMISDTVFIGDMDIKELYREQWKRVQVLSDMFWKKWREGYLQTLQVRRKWQTDEPDVKKGELVLLKDKNLQRKHWSVGVVTNAIRSDSDGKVRKVEVRVNKEGTNITYTRPVTDLVSLVEVC